MGSVFWNWFTNQVAEKIDDRNTRVLNDIAKIANENIRENIFYCEYCALPTLNKCTICKHSYCRRDYYCDAYKITKFSCKECSNCDSCHDKCCVCQKNGSFYEDNAHGLYLCVCGEMHVYCQDHLSEKCLID